MRLIDSDRILENKDIPEELKVYVRESPTIDAIHAHLIARKDDLGYTFHCSKCDTRVYTYSKYCSVCGARLDEPDEVE